MSRARQSYTTEFKVEAAHRVIDSDRSIAEVAREIGVNEAPLGRWVRDERRRMQAAKGHKEEPLSGAERAELQRLRKQVVEQEKDLAFLKKSVGVLCGESAKVTYFELMNTECAHTEVARMARLLPVSRPGYYAWKNANGEISPAEQLREDRKAKILHFHEKSQGTYGAPRITADLRDIGDNITRKTVAKLMADAGIAGISPRTFKVRTTNVDINATFPNDLVERNFDQDAIDLVWTSDITYLHCGEGDMYFCAVKDEHSKRILGWSVDDHMRAELVADSLEQAAMTRSYLCEGTIFHSDRGSQYTSKTIEKLAERLGLLRSMGETGICWDNAGAESLWSTFKHEYYYRHTFATKAELIAAVERWVYRYNHDRRHSAIGQTSPVNYEVSSTAANTAA